MNKQALFVSALSVMLCSGLAMAAPATKAPAKAAAPVVKAEKTVKMEKAASVKTSGNMIASAGHHSKKSTSHTRTAKPATAKTTTPAAKK